MLQRKENLIVEVCVDSVESAIAAQLGGANRVELCDNLLEGGTTPSAGAIEIARKNLNIKLHVIIRPRGGDFCYSDVEFEIMKLDIEAAKEFGADGIVIGILKDDGNVDIKRTQTLIEIARPLSVTFHRAFDMTRDAFKALEDLISLGVERVLTSGQEESVIEGLDLITQLVKQANDRIIIMPGGGVNERNIKKIVEQSKVKEIHVTGFAPAESRMRYRNENVFMGGTLRPPEYTRFVTSAEKIKAIREKSLLD